MNNKGFTLVEIIVAMIIGVLASTTIVLILRMSFTNYKSLNLESQVQIENQVLTEQLKSRLQSCDSFVKYSKDDFTIIEIHSYDEMYDDYMYFNYLLAENQCFLSVTTETLNNESVSINKDNFDYLANYVTDVVLTPNIFNATDSLDFDVDVVIYMNAYDTEYNSTFVTHIKSNN